MKKYEEEVRVSVPTEKIEEIEQNCLHGAYPVPQVEDSTFVTVPVVTSMTKLLFSRCRRRLLTYLEECIDEGILQHLTGRQLLSQRFNKTNCSFENVSFWREDPRYFVAEIKTNLILSTPSGSLAWTGYLSVAGEAYDGEFEFSVQDIQNTRKPRNGNEFMLSPFLIPYFHNEDVDNEGERIWQEYMPESLSDPEKRNARELARRMGLSVVYYPLFGKDSVYSVLFFIQDTIMVEELTIDGFVHPVEVVIPANSILVNTNYISQEYSAINIYHECFHFYEHYMFYCLQNMGNNDSRKIKTKKILRSQAKKESNPVYWLEKQAGRGAYSLMLPAADFSHGLVSTLTDIRQYQNMGDKYEQACDNLSKSLLVPAFRIRARCIQMGHIHAKGAVNYVDKKRIPPFSFDIDSVREEGVTFVLNSATYIKLYETDDRFKKIVDEELYVYAEGHMVWNDTSCVVNDAGRYKLTPWARGHIDECCLRFIRLYEQRNIGEYVFGRMYLDEDYIRQTEIILRDTMQSKKLSMLMAKYEYIKEFPKTFSAAFEHVLKLREFKVKTFAEKLYMDERTLREWISKPDSKINADFIMVVSLLLELPDWISELLLKRAHICLDEEDARHNAFRYIQRAMWMDGLEKANDFLRQNNLDILTLSHSR